MIRRFLFTLLLYIFGSSIYANVIPVPVYCISTEYPRNEWHKYIDMKAKLNGVQIWKYNYTDKDLQYIIQTDPAIDTIEQAEIVLLDYVKEEKIGCTVLLVVGIFFLLLFMGFIIYLTIDKIKKEE